MKMSFGCYIVISLIIMLILSYMYHDMKNRFNDKKNDHKLLLEESTQKSVAETKYMKWMNIMLEIQNSDLNKMKNKLYFIN